MEKYLPRGLLVGWCIRPARLDAVFHLIDHEAGALEVPAQLRKERGIKRSDVQQPQFVKPATPYLGNGCSNGKCWDEG